MPPLPGFFAKLFIFRSVIASGYLVPAVVAFVGSFIGVTYYLALFFRLFTTPALRDDAGSTSSR
jgi:NADH-quinone oxidoreductase subunit N